MGSSPPVIFMVRRHIKKERIINMETFWIIIALQAIICGFLAMNIAEHKGYSEGAWFGTGFFFGIFGLIAAAGLPNKKSTISENRLKNMS